MTRSRGRSRIRTIRHALTFDNSGDSLQPGDLGYENMTAAVSLAFVRFGA
jgi:hypothetical protein